MFDKRGVHKDWRQASEAAIRRIADAWKAVGLTFPVDEIMEGW